MIIGIVSKYQIPLLITFNEKDVDHVCQVLGDSIVRAHEIVDFFSFEIDEGEEYY